MVSQNPEKSILETAAHSKPVICLTVFTSIKPKRLSKRFSLVGGALLKEAGGNMTEGIAERLTLTGPKEFAALLPTLKPNQAVSYGIPSVDRAQVVPQKTVGNASSDLPVIARTRDYLYWPEGPGVMMLDYDPPTDGPGLARDELIATLAKASPVLSTAPMVWRPSASSCLFTGEQELRGIAGQRLYVFIQNASDIPRAGKALVERLWLAGYGRYELSASGAFLARTVIDASVFQPERLDFCGGAECGKGIVQNLPEPILFNPDAPYLDTHCIPDLTPDEQQCLCAAQEALKQALEPEQARVRENWVAARVQERTDQLPQTDRAKARPVLERTYREAAHGGRLPPDFELTVALKGHRVRKVMTVREVLIQRRKWHEATTLDPLEPDYPAGQSRLVGWLNLNAKPPYLQSQAHGGQRFILGGEPATVSAEPDNDPSPPPSPEGLAREEWRAGNQQELPKTLMTVVDILSAPPWLGVFGYNGFRQRIEKRLATPYNGEPGPFSDRDSAETMLYLERDTGTAFGRDTVDLAIMAVAHRNTFNPAQERLRALADQWDEHPRLSTWLVDYAAAKVNDSNREYLAEIGEKWLKGVAARVLHPGCKRDDVLVLRGPQGWFKSTLAQAISDTIHPEAFTDSVDLGNLAEAKIQVRGVIIAELGELAGLARGEVESIKAFVTTKSDHFREKFGKFAEDFPRTVSFIGSTNDQTFLKDPTGNRRWWPVTLDRPIDITRVKQILPQLIGEAARRVLQGEPWFVSNDTALAQAENVRAAHFDEDVWTDEVMRIVNDIESKFIDPLTQDNAITSARILDELKLPRHQHTPLNQRRVAGILKMHGYMEARGWTKGRERKFRYWVSTITRNVGTVGTVGTDRQEADKPRTHCVPIEHNSMGTKPNTQESVPTSKAQRVHSGYGESPVKQPLYPLYPVGPLNSLCGENGEQENSDFPDGPLRDRILDTLRNCPGGMLQADLVRLVSNGKGASPKLIEMVLARLMKEGAIGRTNERLVANPDAWL